MIEIKWNKILYFYLNIKKVCSNNYYNIKI